MAVDREKESRASSASTLEGNRDGPKEKMRDAYGDPTHVEDRLPLPTEVESDQERVEIMRRMSQNAINAMLENPLANKPRESIIRDARRFARQHGMEEDEEDFVKGALVAQNPDDFENIPELSDEDKNALRFEITHKWRQPFTLYFLVGMKSHEKWLISKLCAAWRRLYKVWTKLLSTARKYFIRSNSIFNLQICLNPKHLG